MVGGGLVVEEKRKKRRFFSKKMSLSFFFRFDSHLNSHRRVPQGACTAFDCPILNRDGKETF